MRVLIEHIDSLIVESSGSHYWLVIPFNEGTARSLSRGTLEGVEGISGSRRIIDWWFGGSKAALRMDRNEAERLNPGLVSVSSMGIGDFIRDDLSVLQRLMDQPSFGSALAKFLTNYIEPQIKRDTSELSLLASTFLSDRKFIEHVSRMKTEDDIRPSLGDMWTGGTPLKSMEDLIRQALADYARDQGKDKEMEQDLRWGADGKGLRSIIKKALESVKSMYSSAEDEYLVEGDSLSVPKGSSLFIDVPKLSERAEEFYHKWRAGEDSKDIDFYLNLRGGAGFKKRAKIEDAVKQVDLDSRYDVQFVSGKEEVPS